MAERSLNSVNQIATQTMRYPFKVWGFGEGIALEALAAASDAHNEYDYWPFILQLFDQWVSRPVEEADHSAPGMLLLEAYERTGDVRYLDGARRLAEHMLALPACENGATLHRPQHPEYYDFLYVDCMEVDGPFLCKLATVTDDMALFDAAVQQVVAYAELLQDEETGLFYHQYDRATGQVNGAFWGRGNGWALLGLLKTLTLLPVTHASYGAIANRFQRLTTALVGLQVASGGWHTVLDDPTTYEEASLPAMFGYGLHAASQKGLIDHDVASAVRGAWHVTLASTQDGLLKGVSIATPPGNAAHYAGIPRGSGYPWGQGPLLLFALSQARA